MATRQWVGKGQKRKQAGTITPVAANNATYTIGIPDTTNGKLITYLADASATVAEITAGLVAALNASEDGEFQEITWTDNTTYIGFEVNEAGRPVTVASAASAGSLTTAATVTNASPNDINDAQNWSGNTVPGNNDTALFDTGAIDALWNLDALSAVTGLTVIRRRSYKGRISLPVYNENGTPYYEYRATEFLSDGGTFTLEQRADDPVASLKFNHGSTAGTLTLIGEGKGALGDEQAWVRGTSAASVYNVQQATLAIAPEVNSTANVATIRCQDSTVRCGQGTAFATSIVNHNSEIEVNSNLPAAYTQTGDGAVSWVRGTATGSSPDVEDGVMHYMSSGTLTTPTIGSDATLDFSLDNRTRTISGTVQLYKGATYNDPASSTYAGGLAYKCNGCTSQEVTVNLGPGRTFTVT